MLALGDPPKPLPAPDTLRPGPDYVRRWVRELALLPASVIHQPWRAAPLELAGARVTLAKTYPEPIIDHRRGRERALNAYAKVRAS